MWIQLHQDCKTNIYQGITDMKRCDCDNCKGVNFDYYCKKCGHGVAVMEVHSRGPSWDGICSHCHSPPQPKTSEPMDDVTSGKVNANIGRYFTAANQLYTAVKLLANFEPNKDITPTSLRTGVNESLVEHAALVRTLIKKGIITEDEYTAEQANEMEREVERYRKRLAKYFPKDTEIELI